MKIDETKKTTSGSDAGNSTSEEFKSNNLNPGVFADSGLTPERVAEAKAKLAERKPKAKSGNRLVLQKAVVDHAQEIIDEYEETTLFCAKTVGEWLQERDYIRTAQGTKHRRFNALGDLLGKHGLNLPCRNLGGKKRYDLSSVLADSSTKAVKHQQLLDLEPAEVAALNFA